jgi:TPR repeat protein
MPRVTSVAATVLLALAAPLAALLVGTACAGAPPQKSAPRCARETPDACLEEARRLEADPAQLAARRHALTVACEGGLGLGCLALGESFRGDEPDAYLAHSAFERGCTRDVGRACFRSVERAREPEGNLQLRMEVDATLAKGCKLGDLPSCARLGARRVDEGQPEVALPLLTSACGALASDAKAAKLEGALDERARAEACGVWGGLLLAGKGTAKDAARGLALSRAACERGAAAACTDLAFRAREGNDAPRDAAAARDYAERGCQGSDKRACLLLGEMLGAGEGGPDDPRRGEALLRGLCDGSGGLCGEAWAARIELLRRLERPTWMATHVHVPDRRAWAALFDAATPRALPDAATGAPVTVICRLDHDVSARRLTWRLGPLAQAVEYGAGKGYVFLAPGIDLRKGDAVFFGLSDSASGTSIGGLTIVGLPAPSGLGGVDVTSWPIVLEGKIDALPLSLSAPKGSVECRGLSDAAVERAIAPGLASLAKLEAKARGPHVVRLDAEDLGYDASTPFACEQTLFDVAALAGFRSPQVRAAIAGVLDVRATWLAAVRARLPALLARAKPEGKAFFVSSGKASATLRGVACDVRDPEAARLYGACAATLELAPKGATTEVPLATLPSCTAIRADGRTTSLIRREATDANGKDASASFAITVAGADVPKIVLRAPSDDGPVDPKRWAVAIRCGDTLLRVPGATPDAP